MSPEWASAIAETLMALIAACALLYARRQLTEAKKTREQQTRPYVVCYLERNPKSDNLVDVVIKNYGLTAAYDVRAVFGDPLERGVPSKDPIRQVAIPERLPILAPGQDWRTYFDGGNSDREKLGLPMVYEGTVTYEGDPKSRKGAWTKYSTDLVLDYKQFLGILYVSK